VAVTDVDRAIAFYRAVFGATLLLGPVEFTADAPHAADFLGPDFQRTRAAYLGLGNGVSLEIFEFVDPQVAPRAEAFPYWQTGFFHIAVVDPDLEGLVRRIEVHGGRRRSATWEIFPGRWAAFTEDPFGNVIEIYSHTTEQVVSNREPQPEAPWPPRGRGSVAPTTLRRS